VIRNGDVPHFKAAGFKRHTFTNIETNQLPPFSNAENQNQTFSNCRIFQSEARIFDTQPLLTTDLSQDRSKSEF
jgi:hypothetical protein